MSDQSWLRGLGVPPKDRITPGQLKVYFAICGHIDRHGIPPTVRWLAETLKRAINSVVQQLQALKKKGLLEIEAGSARAYRPLYRVEAV